MIKIRLARYGKKNDPFYRVVATEQRSSREGKNLDNLGHWHPKSNLLKLDKKQIQAWVGKGAQISPAVSKLLEK